MKLVLVTAGGEESLLAVDTFDTFYDAPWSGYAKHTGTRSLTADVASHAGTGETVTLEMRVEDVGDGRRDSAVFVDAIRLLGPADPIAVANFDYREAAVNESIRFDASASVVSTPTASYHWDFDNGFVSDSKIVDFAYTAGGIYSGTLTVTDADNHSSTDAFTVAVGGIINRQPHIVSTAVITAKEGGNYKYQVVATDPEIPYGDTLIYSLDTAPDGMAIDPATGLITWTPTSSSPENSSVTVRVTDSMGLFDTQDYNITVDTSTFIIATGDDGRVWYAKSNGDGTWGAPRFIAWAPNDSYIRGVTIGDFDNDGFLDFIIPAWPSRTDFYLYKNDGNDNFTNVGIVATTGSSLGQSEAMATGDFNHDGNLDFVATYESGYYSIGLGDGHGHFTLTTVNSGIGNGRGMAAGDFNNDGALDFIRSTTSGGYAELFLNDGNGNFPTSGPVVASTGDPYGLMAGDFDGDGNVDFVQNNGGSGDPYFYHGNGDGTFAGGVYVSGMDVNNYSRYAAYDFDRDGNLDGASASYGSQVLRFHHGNGDGTFGTTVTIGSTPGSNILGLAGPPTPRPAHAPVPKIVPNPVMVAKGSTVNLDGAFSTDDGTITSYDWSFLDGGTATGPQVSHSFPGTEGVSWARLKVTDDTAHASLDTAPVYLLGDPPVADAGGPYNVGEANAVAGLYTVALDGTGSHDAEGPIKYYAWDSGNGLSEDFEAAQINPRRWTTIGNVQLGIGTTGNEAVLSRTYGAWDQAILSKKVYQRQHGQSFTGRVRISNAPTSSHYVMWGLKTNNTTLAENQWLYAFYYYNGQLRIYEKGSNRATVFSYTQPTELEFRIDVKTQGATYYYRPVGTIPWIFVWDSPQFTDSDYLLGAMLYAGTAGIDNLTASSDKSTDPQPSFQYVEEGTYNVSLAVTDQAFQTNTDNTTVTAAKGAPPVANAGGPYVLNEHSASCNSWTVTFDGTGSSDDNAILSYQWDFGDGSTGIGATPTHIYAGPGTYNVSLTVTDQSLQTSIANTTVTTTAQGVPVANTGGPYIVSEAQASNGLYTVNVSAAASTDDVGICDYTWNWGDGSPNGAGVNATHQYTANGAQQVRTLTLTVRDNAYQSNQAQTTVTLNVEDPPVANSGGPYTVDEAQAFQGQWTVPFNASASTDTNGIYKYDWTFGDGTTGTGALPVKKYNDVSPPGSPYPVTLKVTDNVNQTNTVGTTVAVLANDPPVPVINAPTTAGESYAVGGIWHVPFDATGSTDDFGIWKYEWDFGDGQTGTGDQITHDYSVPGDYTVTLTVTDHAKQAVSVQQVLHVIKNDPPVANAGGPYNVTEAAASNGIWRALFNGTGSTDDTGIFDYQWWVGPLELNEPFDGTTIDSVTWATAGATQSDNLSIVGTGSWGNRYAFTNGTFARQADKVFTARVLPQTTGTYAMIGWKNNSTNYSYTQLPHAIYFDNGTIQIYENGSNRGSFGSYVGGVSYDVRIILLETGGALYEYKRSDSASWINLYATYSDTSTDFKAGIVVNGGTLVIDDVRVGTILEGPTVHKRFMAPGTYDLTLTVRDNALQSSTDTTTVDVGKGDPPVANAGGPYTIEQGMLLALNSTASHDDYGIETYHWDFGDGSTGTSANPRHFWDTPGQYTVSLTVTDRVGQSDTATTTVDVITGNPPTANAGGPYTAGTNGVPAFLDGAASFDDYGIANWLWYVDTADTSGTPTHVGRKVTHLFTTAGAHTVMLKVVDGAGQTSTSQATVNVSATLPPKVITVPWVGTDPVVPHETWPGKLITFKGMEYSNNATQYQWDFGDGTQSSIVAINANNRRTLEARHAYDANIPVGTPFIATLTVWDNLGNSSSATYNIIVKGDSLNTEVNVAIDEGLWFLYKNQSQANNSTFGSWYNAGYYAGVTGSSVNAFMINSHQPEGDPSVDPYIDTVRNGLDFIFNNLFTPNIQNASLGNADVNGNTYGVRVNSGRAQYEGGPVIDALVASNTPLRMVNTSNNSYPLIRGKRFWDIAQEMVEDYGYCQLASGANRGGWRYSCASDHDTSAAQWAAIGIIPAERLWGNKPPTFIKSNNLNVVNNVHYDLNGQAGYTSSTYCAWGCTADTPSNMVQMNMDGVTVDDRLFISSSGYMRNALPDHFTYSTPAKNDQLHQNYYAMFATSKAMRLANPVRLDIMCQACGDGQDVDWYGDPNVGLAPHLIAEQILDQTGDHGSWKQPSGLSGSGDWQQDMVSAWAVLILTRELFEVAPVADAGPDRVWAVNLPLTFDGSHSYHPDPFRTIVKYEWDFDGDGVYNSSSSSPTAQHTYTSAQSGTLPHTFVATLRVTDDAGKTGTDTATIIIAVPPHPPIADAGGPYTCTAGLPCHLDGSGSFDIDPTDFITSWSWELGGGGVPDFAEASGETVDYVFPTPGVFNIGVKVFDNAVLNDVNGNDQQDPEERLSDQNFTTATVVQNEPPVANPGGPYVVDEGQPVMLDGTASSDPNGDPLTYSWDLDSNGTFETAGAQVTHTFPANGSYTVTLRVTDTLLSDQAPVMVIVNDLSPTAAFAPPSGTEGTPVSFTDASTTPVDPIVAWHWDFGGQGTSDEQNSTFAFADNGTYPVMLTVTDSDGSMSSITHNVTIGNAIPVVDAGQNRTVTEGDTVTVAATFTDKGVNDAPFTATIDWGDGSGATNATVGGTAQAGTAGGSHVYADNGNYTVTVTVTDKDGGHGSDVLGVTVDNADPVVVAGGDRNVFVGQNVPETATFTDAGTADTHMATIDWGNSSSGPVPVTETNGSGSATGSHIYAAAGDFPVTVKVTDDDSGMGTGSFTVHVTFQPAGLAVEAGPNQTIDEGQSATLASSFSFTNADTFTAMVDWGDGTVEPATIAGTAIQGSHVYPDNGSFTVTVSVHADNSGEDANDSLTVTVNNKPPVVDAGADRTVTAGDTVNLNATFSDVGVNDAPFAATIDWGDGSAVENATVGGTASAGTAGGSHAYAAAGVYTVTVTVNDKDGGSAFDTLQVTVNPAQAAEQTIFDLVAHAKPSKIDLVWTPVQGATGYNIYRSTSHGGPYQLISAGYQCSYCAFTDASLANGTTYYYVVTSIGGGAESLYSNEASGTPQDIVIRGRR